MINRYCENCGKILNKKTLICEACGTDYNEKPKCDHFYDFFAYMDEPRTCSTTLVFRCSKCKEEIKLNCDPNMFRHPTGGRAIYER